MKYHIITYGCQMNKSDSERIASVLESIKYEKTLDINGADLIVVNMCSVRQSAVDRVHGLVQKLKTIKKSRPKGCPELKTILTGCILKKDKNIFINSFDYIVDIRDIKKLPKILASPNFYDRRNLEKLDYLDIAPKYSNKFSANVPIMTGCNNFCSYCVVPYTRGREISRPADDILCEVKNLVKMGYKEIWLLGQNVNSYKSQIPNFKLIKFPKLLKMVNDIPGDFQIRFISPHPKDFSDELIDTMSKCQKVARFLNLPVQSGDDKILKKMNRNYTAAEYKKLVRKIRKKMPDINLSTDVIVGFPGETKRQFENTAKFFKEIKYDIAYINKYSPRAGTAATKLKDNISVAEKKRREKVLREILNSKKSKKLIVILGPNASGKTDLSIKLAKKFNGEVVSADSRQVYKGMDIGTGKITKKEMAGIPHYLLDVASPKQRFTVANYQKLAKKTIEKIHKKGKLPFLVGGTGFYIQAVVDNISLPKVKPDWKLRKKLEKKTASELFEMLKKLDPRRAKNIDKNNPRRLIRAIEIARKLGTVPGLSLSCPPYDVLIIGVKRKPEELKKRIEKRLEKRLKQGMINEVKKLRKSGVSWKRLEEFGLEYRYIAQYLQNKITYNEMLNKIQKESEHYAKRQMTWFKKDKRIKWAKNYKQAEKLTRTFLFC